jgi:hypothetical protein
VLFAPVRIHEALARFEEREIRNYPDRNASFIPSNVVKDPDLIDSAVARFPVHEFEIDGLDFPAHVAVGDKNWNSLLICRGQRDSLFSHDAFRFRLG